MTARLVRPNKQTEIERIVTKLQKLHARLRLRQNIRHLLRCSNQSRRNQIYIGIVRDANRYRNTSTRISIRPVHNPLANKLRIRHDNRDSIVCGDYSRAQVNTLHVAFIFTDRDPIADPYRTLEKQNETRCDIRGDVLKTEADANRKRGKEHRDRSEIDRKRLLQSHQQPDRDDDVLCEPADRITQSWIDVTPVRKPPLDQKT